VLPRALVTAALAAVVTVTSLAQGGGGPATPLQEFADKLKLDPRTQLPAVQEWFGEAAREAAPIAQEMVELRRQLVNLELTNRSAETKAVLEGYATAAAKMAGLETRVFQQVYATLKPAQQSKAAEAFAFMAGFFQSSAGRGGRGPRGGGGQ
jgi:hypothetical protein